MIPPLLRLANATVRTWARVYTWRLAAHIRDARREDIESDLWESEHDPAVDNRYSLPLRVFARMVLGVPDDLGGRNEQEQAMDKLLRVGIVLTGGIAGALALWLVLESKNPPRLPALPAPPVRTAAKYPLPPPPSPPVASPGRTNTDVPWTYGQTSYAASGNVRPPAKVKDVRPVYPPILAMAGVSGIVVVEATIDQRGSVADARIARSSGIFNQSAIDAVRQWQFEPTTVNGVPVPVTITVTVQFTPPA